MTDERAMEILDPDHREHYESIEPINEACRIGIAAIKRVKELEAENAALRERLEKAVELPCKIGDTVYQTDTNGTRIFKSTVKGIIFDTGGVAFDERAISENIFLTEKAVKEKMKKLQEKYND